MKKVSWEEKSAWFSEKLKKHPNRGSLWLRYGDFLEEECDEPQKTIFAYKKAKKLMPNKDLRLRLGIAYSNAGEFTKAISVIKESLNENPRPDGYCILADVYIKNDMNEEAISACEKAIELESSYEEAYYLLGEAIKSESKELAVEYYKKAIQFDPDYQLSWQALGRELIATSETIEEGILALRKAVELDPEDGWAQIYLANALWKKGEIDEADKWYRSALAIYPDFPDLVKWYNQFLNSKIWRLPKEGE